jgi:lauroyl/myristoyl acyltransferase
MLILNAATKTYRPRRPTRAFVRLNAHSARYASKPGWIKAAQTALEISCRAPFAPPAIWPNTRHRKNGSQKCIRLVPEANQEGNAFMNNLPHILNWPKSKPPA